MKKTKPTDREVIGWRELVGLPELGISELAAKIDTGARTSALHAEDREVFERDGQRWVRFRAPKQKNTRPRVIEAPVLAEREIKNTSGVPESRLIMRTLLILGGHSWHIDVSLADRDAMTFDLIIGRTAFRGRRILVDPARSYLSKLTNPKTLHAEGVQNTGISPLARKTK